MRSPKFSLYSTLLLMVISGCAAEKTSTDYIQNAKKFSDAGELKSAVIEARNAVKADPTSSEARELLGIYELRTNNYQNSEKAILKAIELGTPASDLILELSQALLKQGKYNEVLALDVESTPNNIKATVLANKAAAHLALNDIANTDKFASSALQLDASSTEALIVMARSSALKNGFESAREHIATVLEASSENAEAWELLGQLESREKNFDEAIVAYSNAVDYADNKFTPLLGRAQTYIKIQKYDEASQDFTIIEKSGVKHPFVFQGKAELLFLQGDYQEAQLQLEEALVLDPEFLPAVRSIALAHLVLGNLGQAEQYAKQLLNANESNTARTLLGAIRLENERFEQAETTLAPIAESGTLDLTSTRMLATAYLKQGKYEQAIELIFNTQRSLVRAGSTEIPNLALNQRPAQALVNQDQVSSTETNSYLSSQNAKIVETADTVAREPLTKALAAVDELQNQLPDSSVPHSLRGRAYLVAEDTENAKASFEKAISLSPNDSILVAMIADIVRIDNPAEATQLLEKALSNASGDAREKLMLKLASHSSLNNEPAAVLEWLRKAKSENSDSFQTNLALAQYHAATGQKTDALAAIASINNAYQSISYVAELNVASMVGEQRFDDAIKKLDDLLIQSPASAKWYFWRAQAYAGKSDYEQTALDLEQALSIDPNHYPSLMASAKLKIGLDDLPSAEGHINTMESLGPENEALSAVKAKLTQAKLAPKKQGSQQQFKDTDGVKKGITQFLQNRQPENALLLANKWLEKHPNDVIILTALGDTYVVLDQVPEAIQAYRKAVDIRPDNFIALNNLAWFLRDSEPETSLKYVEQALKLKPDDVNTLDTLAIIMLEQGNTAGAKEAFEQTQNLGATDPNILFHGALIEFELGNSANARKILQPIMESDVNFAERADAEALYEKLK